MPQGNKNRHETTSGKDKGQSNKTSEYMDEWLDTIPEVEDTIMKSSSSQELLSGRNNGNFASPDPKKEQPS
jgi:hypothetical protein